MARPKFTREECDYIRHIYADRTRKETSGTIARLYRVSTGTIIRILDNNYTPLEDYEAKKIERRAQEQTMTAKVLKMTPKPDALCRHCGHEYQDHNPECEAGAGCAGDCPCKRFVSAK